MKARTKKTMGAGSRKAGLAMAFKLLLAAEKRWRKINAPHLVALVQAGVRSPDGQRQLAPIEEGQAIRRQCELLGYGLCQPICSI